MRLRALCRCAANDAETSSNITISFVAGAGVAMRSYLGMGHRPPLYLLHYFNVNLNRMNAADGLKFP